MKSQLANLKGSSPSGTNLPRPQTTGPSSTQKLSAAAASLGQQGTPSGTPGAPGQPPNQGITRFLIVFVDTMTHLMVGHIGDLAEIGAPPTCGEKVDGSTDVVSVALTR